MSSVLSLAEDGFRAVRLGFSGPETDGDRPCFSALGFALSGVSPGLIERGLLELGLLELGLLERGLIASGLEAMSCAGFAAD